MNTITVAIADDHKLFVDGLSFLVNQFEGMEVVMTAENGKVLVEKIQESEKLPDIILLDIKMPEMGGIETTQTLLKMHPAIKIIIISMQAEELFIYHLISKGALGYLSKNAEPSEVEQAIRNVYEEGYYFPDRIIRIMHKHIKKQNENPVRFIHEGQSLSPRERDLLRLVCMEKSNQEIANALSITIRTVEGYRKNLMVKIGAKNSIGMVMYALKHGIISF